MKQKKCYKTFKFWITTLLALSASSIITSLALTSCVANDNTNKSDIVINNQTEDKEFSIDDSNDLTLSVDATSNSGVVLCYQWYVNKDANANENSWEKIAGATQKTYTITASEIKDIEEETTWRYKADIYPENNENQKIESKPIPVKIKPPVGGSVPDKPIEPPTPDNPDQGPTPPENPENPPVNPPTDGQPSPTPPNIDNNRPGIVPSPPYQPSKGIGARLPLDKNGIVTTKYDQEKWIGDNSVSLLIEARPNAKGISDAVNKFIKNSSDPNIIRILQDFSTTVGLASNLSNSYYNQFGTGWILDYSDGNSSNIKDYYIATNMHVMSSYFTFTFTSTRYGSGSDEPIEVGVRIPFNKTTVSNLNVYISQPKYSTEDQKNNEKSYADQLSTQWYKTNVDIKNWENDLIPIGAYNPQTNTGFKYSQGFDMELTWQYLPPLNTNIRETLYFKSSSNGDYLVNKPDIGNSSFQHGIDDFSVFKISLGNNEFDKMITDNNQYKNMFQNMKNLFDTTNTAGDVKENSSYIKRLNKLLEIINTNKYDKQKVDELFMFSDSNKITKSDTQISIGGYPLIQEVVPDGNTYKRQSYTTFNTNTLTGNNIIDYPHKYYNTRDKMGINQYTYKGNMYKIKWKDPNNFILKNVNLLAGSSGGMGIDKNYKLSCINWGTFIQIEYYQGIKYVLDSSSSTGLYSSTDKNSLIWKWVDYVNKNGKQTKLAQLFNNLEKLHYFN